MIIQKNLAHDKLTEFFQNFLGSSVKSAMVSLMEDKESDNSNLYASYKTISEYLKDFNPKSPFGVLNLSVPVMLSMKDGTLVELNEQENAVSFARHDPYECSFFVMDNEGKIHQLT